MLDTIICADWSKEARKRDAYVADVRQRVVRRLGLGQLTVRSLVAAARTFAPGSVLVGIDTPIGAPRSLLEATYQGLDLSPSATFTEWLARLSAVQGFFDQTNEPEAWSPLRPFFSVPAGPDGLGRWLRMMKSQHVDACRRVDLKTSAKSLFILSGIPGSVGSSVRDVWEALAGIIGEKPEDLRVWPFDQADPAEGTGGVLIAEIYPRALYAAALLSEPPEIRPRLAVAKTDPKCRRVAIETLLANEWVRQHGVRFEDVDAATMTEDACDALLSAAGVLRCVLDGVPLGWKHADAFEGGILGLESVNLGLPERTFLRPVSFRKKRGEPAGDSPFLRRPEADWIASNRHAFAIPDGFPVSPGHTLVVTRRLVPTWFEATTDEQRAVMQLVETVKGILDRRTPAPAGYNVGFNAGEAAGQTVMHLHVHVIPRYPGDVPDPRGGIRHVIPGRGNYLDSK